MWVLLVLLLALPLRAQPTATPSAEPVSSPTPLFVPTPSFTPLPVMTPVMPLAEIAAQAETVANSLRDIETGLANDQVFSTVRAELPEVSRQIATHLEENSKVMGSHPTLDALRGLETDWTSIQTTVQAWKTQLTAQASGLDAQLEQLSRLRHTWSQYLHDAQGAAVPAETRDRMESALTQIDLTEVHVESRRAQILRLQDRVGEEDARIERGVGEVVSARQIMVHGLLDQDSPPLWNAQIRAQIGLDLLINLEQSLANQSASLREYAQQNPGSGLIHFCVFSLLVLLLGWVGHRVRPWVRADSHLETATRVFLTPISSGLVLSVFFSPWIYVQAPRILLALLGAAALLPTVVILRRLVETQLIPVLYVLTMCYFVDQVRNVAISMPILARLIFCMEMLAGAVFLVWFIHARRKSQDSDKFIYCGRLVLGIFVGALLANVMGHVNLANLIGNAVLGSAYIAVVLSALVKIMDGLSLFAVRVRPLVLLGVVRNHRRWVRSRLRQTLRILASLLWLLATLEMLTLRAPLAEVFHSTMEAQMGLGALHTTVGDVLAFFFTVWVAFFSSRALRFILDEDVYPRVTLSRGLPYAISTLSHYTILLVGFLVAMTALGVDATKFAVLAGAFGVGLGFGLQNIVSNFISGLILLFERPVKVGDVIQFGTFQGNLSQIGLRASILQVGDGSEVIIPNAQLISERVINWTLSDQQRRMEIALGVGHDSDPQKVIDILQNVAQSHPQVLRAPEPEALFVDVGENSLKFKLQAWTLSFGYDRVRSQMLIQIKADFQQAGIVVIPRPQRDIHVEGALSMASQSGSDPPEGGLCVADGGHGPPKVDAPVAETPTEVRDKND